MRNHAPKYATDKQKAFIASLLNDRIVPGDLAHEAQEIADIGTSQQASGIIDRLLEEPRAEHNRANPERVPDPDVAAGRYALPDDVEDQVPVFYKVDRPEEGRWAGRTFVTKLVGPNEVAVKNPADRTRILGLIAANPMDALRRYGSLSGHCGNCGLELTDKFSRFIGVGPVCREKLGLDKSEAEFVRKGGILPDSYVREVAAEEEAARVAAGEASLPFPEQAARRAINERAEADPREVPYDLAGDAAGRSLIDERDETPPDDEGRHAAEEARIAEGGQASEVEADLRAIRSRFSRTVYRPPAESVPAGPFPTGPEDAEARERDLIRRENRRPGNATNGDIVALARRISGEVA